MRPEIELGHLKYFYFTVLEGGVGPAADRLCVQQPVVSKMIRSLEEQFGEPLFRKQGRKNVLTDFGQLVFRHSQNVFGALQEVSELAQTSQGGEKGGALNIGAADAISTVVLPKVLKPFLKAHAKLNPNIYTSTATHLIEMISEGKLDLGLFFHLPTLPDNVEVIERIPVKFVVVIATEFADSDSVRERFIGSREIDDLSNKKFPTVELLKETHPKTRIAISSNSLVSHKAMVLEGLGISVLPEFLVSEELKDKKLKDLFPKRTFKFDLKIIARQSSSPTPAQKALLKALTKTLSEI